MSATLISPSGVVLHHRARCSTTPADQADAKAVPVCSSTQCRLDETRTVLKHRNVRAFLRAVSATLGCAYDSGCADYSAHPGAAEAGAYRLPIEAWLDKGAALGLSDFMPETQDLIAVDILRGLGALGKVQKGDVWSALLSACACWPGLPCQLGVDGRYATPAVDYERFCEVYRRYGGTIDQLGDALAFGRAARRTSAAP